MKPKRTHRMVAVATLANLRAQLKGAREARDAAVGQAEYLRQRMAHLEREMVQLRDGRTPTGRDRLAQARINLREGAERAKMLNRELKEERTAHVRLKNACEAFTKAAVRIAEVINGE